MWDVFPEAIDWNIALHTQILFWVVVSEVRFQNNTFRALTTLNLPYFLKCFWDKTSDILA